MSVRPLLDHPTDRASWNNEEGDLTRVEFNRRNSPDPTMAVFDCDGVPVSIPLYPEDRRAFERGGYTISSEGKFSPRNPTVRLEFIRDDLRIRQIQHADMVSWLDIRRAGEPRQSDKSVEVIHMVSSSVMEPEDNAPGNVVSGPFGNRQPVKSNDGTPPPAASLYAKMAQVMGLLNKVDIPKNGTSQQGWPYVTDEDLYRAVQKAMSECGLAMLPPQIVEIREGGKQVDILFTLACGDTGATISTPWIGIIGNGTDKAIHAMMTMCTKYFLKSTFLIATGDPTDDADHGAGQGSKPATPKKQAAQTKRLDPQQYPSTTPAGSAAPAQPKATPPAAAPQESRKNLTGFFANGFSYTDFYAGIKDQFDNTTHRDNALVKMVDDVELTEGMSVAEAIKAVADNRQRRVAEKAAQS